jgi:predicted lysophospholipase L1 biosynthesis ABC-type transport system permease subunit
VSLLVGMLEQLRERRRVLAGLIALGVRRRTLGWSVLWQTAVPVAVGMIIAIAGGVAMGAVLLKIVNEPMTVDWASVGALSGIATVVVVVVTGLSLAPLRRLMRTEGLRSE